MTRSRNDILIQNIIKCSADAKISSAEIDLLIFAFLDDIKLSGQSLWDIKATVSQKLELLRHSLSEADTSIDLTKIQVSMSKYISQNCTSYFEEEEIIKKNLNFVKIAYWYTNRYAQEAALAFSELFNRAEEICAESFSAVCEEISDDITLGVIPIANSSDGKLMSFYRLLDKFDLKISAACNVENPNGNGFSRFALVGKKIIDIGSYSDKVIEFAVGADFFSTVRAIELIGGMVKEITSIPSHHSPNECLNYFTVSVKKESIHELWWFLYLFGGEIEFIGIYSEI